MARTNDKSRVARRERRTASEWQAEVSAWRASGLTAAQYAETRNIHPGTLFSWAGRLNDQIPTAGRMAPTAPPPNALGRAFLPVKLRDERNRVDDARAITAEIVLVSGRRVRVSGELKLEQLSQLLDAVDRGSAC